MLYVAGGAAIIFAAQHAREGNIVMIIHGLCATSAKHVGQTGTIPILMPGPTTIIIRFANRKDHPAPLAKSCQQIPPKTTTKPVQPVHLGSTRRGPTATQTVTCV